jgi:serine/threonine protein phosphatase 1
MRWIIGDVHGMLRSLVGLIRAIEHADSHPTLYFVGDYVNRGADSRGVIDLLLSLPNVRCARGNHDDVFDLILSGKCHAPDLASADRGFAFQWFWQHGLMQTVASYGLDMDALSRFADAPNPQQLDELLAEIPQSHRKFLRGLPPAVEEKDFFVAHAKWEPSDRDQSPGIFERLKLEPSLHRTLLWGRFVDSEVSVEKEWRRTGFFGHTPVDHYDSPELRPVTGPKLVLLDTACALAERGRLTAWCFEEARAIQVNRAGAVVSS